MLVIEDVLGRCAPLLGIDPVDLRRRNFYVDGPGHALRAGRPPPGARRRGVGPGASTTGEVAAPARGDRGLQRRPRPHQARARGDPAEVRHLLQLHRVQPGRCARARLQGRLGADQPRRHRDGPGPAHQDAAGRRDQPRASRWSGCGSRRPGPTRCPTPPRRRPARAPTSTAVPSRTPASRSPPGCARSTPGRDLPWDDLVREAYFGRVQLWAAGFYRTEGIHWDSTAMQGHPFKYFAYGVAAAEVEVDGFTGAHRTRRVDIVHDVGDSLSPLVDIGQIEGGFVQGVGLAHARGPAVGRVGRPRPRSADHPVGQHLQAAEHRRAARRAPRRAARARPRGRRGLRLQGGRRAAADAGLRGARGAARGGRRLRPGRHQRRPRRPRPRRRRCSGPWSGPAGRARTTWSRACPAWSRSRRTPPRPRCTRRPSGGADVHWLTAVERLREEREAGVLVTVIDVRGHAPRDAGAKMVVAADAAWGSVGGGNLEETAVARARAMLGDGAAEPEQLDGRAQRQGPHRARPAVLRRRGRRSCSSRCRCVPAVAVFGVGHVGLELARVLVRHDLDLHLVDSRAAQLDRRAAGRPRRRGGAGPGAPRRRCPSSPSGRCRAAPTCW